MKDTLGSEIRLPATNERRSAAYDLGRTDGAALRMRGTEAGKFVRAGNDEYCLGFRAGYFERGKPGPARKVVPAMPRIVRTTQRPL